METVIFWLSTILLWWSIYATIIFALICLQENDISSEQPLFARVQTISVIVFGIRLNTVSNLISYVQSDFIVTPGSGLKRCPTL